MEALQEFLEDIKRHKLDQGHFLGLCHILIGRNIAKADGTAVSSGLTWRELSAWLKKVRWNKDAVAEVGLEPEELPPRDRQQYWYSAIARARVDTPEAAKAGDKLADKVKKHGYVVGPPPGNK